MSKIAVVVTRNEAIWAEVSAKFRCRSGRREERRRYF